MERPNILFICTDQQSALAMGNTGNKQVATPHMDALAASGVNFRKSFCSYPLCSPARASHFTGLMPHQTGVTRNGIGLPPDIPTVMGPVFRNASYETVWAGKWHIPETYPREENTVPGFRCVPLQPGPDETRDRLYTEEAIRFLQAKPDRPFLLSLQLHDPHEICSVFHGDLPPLAFPDDADLPPLPDNHEATAVEPDVITAFRIEEMHGYKEVHKWGSSDWSRFRELHDRYIDAGDAEAGELLHGMRKDRWSDGDWRRYVYVYYRFVERADRQVGRIMAALKANGLEESTLVVFTSDHGDGMGAHRWTRKLMFYEECMRVPLCLAWKGVIPPGIDDEQHLVSGIDLLPTLCDYAGIELEGDLPGKSIRPVIENPQTAGREYVVGELTPLPNITDGAWQGRMLRTHDRKYIVFDQGERTEMLFDLEADPLETVNVADDVAYEGAKSKLRERLEGCCRETGDDFRCRRTRPAQQV